jgi:hypothetical protein
MDPACILFVANWRCFQPADIWRVYSRSCFQTYRCDLFLFKFIVVFECLIFITNRRMRHARQRICRPWQRRGTGMIIITTAANANTTTILITDLVSLRSAWWLLHCPLHPGHFFFRELFYVLFMCSQLLWHRNNGSSCSLCSRTAFSVSNFFSIDMIKLTLQHYCWIVHFFYL